MNKTIQAKIKIIDGVILLLKKQRRKLVAQEVILKHSIISGEPVVFPFQGLPVKDKSGSLYYTLKEGTVDSHLLKKAWLTKKGKFYDATGIKGWWVMTNGRFERMFLFKKGQTNILYL